MSVDCLILGDSIAVGVGQDRPGCVTIARVGINSSRFVQTLLPASPKQARRAVISLGVNDDPAMNTAEALRRMRNAIQADQVTWLLPAPREDVRRAIRLVAAEHGDALVDTINDVGPDHLHPTGSGYRRIAAQTAQGGASATTPPPRPVAVAAALPLPHFATPPGMPRVIYLSPPTIGLPPAGVRRDALNWPPPFYLGRPAPLLPRAPAPTRSFLRVNP